MRLRSTDNQLPDAPSQLLIRRQVGNAGVYRRLPQDRFVADYAKQSDVTQAILQRVAPSLVKLSKDTNTVGAA